MTFTQQRPSDAKYWSGSATTGWQASVANLAASYTSTAGVWTSTATLPTWTDGQYAVQATATDNAGNRTTGAAVTFTYDATKPTVTVNQAAGQADPTNVKPISFTVAFGEPVSGLSMSSFTVGGTARRLA